MPDPTAIGGMLRASSLFFRPLRVLGRALFGDAPSRISEETTAETVASISRAIHDQRRAVVLVGNLLMVKTPDDSGGSNLLTLTLTPAQMKILSTRHSLLKDPANLVSSLEALDEVQPIASLAPKAP